MARSVGSTFDTILPIARQERVGAINWGLFHDVENPSRYVETFVSESWTEHLRQHERITKADLAIEQHAISFHIGKDSPRISHLIGENVSKGKRK